MHQLDKRPPKQKIEAHEGQQSRRVIKHSASGLFHLAALLDEIRLQDFTEAAETSQLLDHLLKRLAPLEGGVVDITQHLLHDLCDVEKFDLFVVNLRGSAESKVLHQQEVDLVAVHMSLRGFLKMTVDEASQIGFFSSHGLR